MAAHSASPDLRPLSQRRSRAGCSAQPSGPVPQRDAVGVDLDLHRGLQVVPIAARHGEGQRQAALPGPVEHPAVTRLQSVETQSQAPQAIALVRIGTGQVNHQPGGEPPVQLVQRLLQCGQVGIVIASVGQLDVQVTGFLAEREVAGPVQDRVNTVSSLAKMLAVPLPWCTSRSITATRRVRWHGAAFHARPASAAPPRQRR
jgi:hypothetical protein